MKIVALALAAALMTACSPGSGDALPPSATPSSQPPSEALTMACAQFGSAPVTDLARLIALENPAERDRGLADISDTVIGIASDVEQDVEQAAASAPGTQAGALAALDAALTDYSTALTAYRESGGDPYGPALGPVIEAMASVQAACAAGSAPGGGGETGESSPA